jgi:type II secretory pathway pseudopilin PulG
MIVVILIIGIMAGITVPAYYQSIERGRAQEAVDVLNDLHGAQERYNAKYGNYCNTAGFACAGFDTLPPTLTNFNWGPVGGAPGWSVALTRNKVTPWYGAYTIVYSVQGASGATFVCTNAGGTGGPCQTFMPAAH